MCKPASKGGRRCSGHTRAALQKATVRLDEATASGVDARIASAGKSWYTAAVNYASTQVGWNDFYRQWRAAQTAGDTERAQRLEHVVNEGSALASRRELVALEHAGYITDEWARWQQGDCAIYAVALQQTHPGLRFGTLTNADGMLAHHFAHDDTHAYDSAGKHPLPYHGIKGDLPGMYLDEQASDYGADEEGDPEDYEAAADHIRRHGIGAPAEAAAVPAPIVATRPADVVTGQPVTVPYIHNREKAPTIGALYGQDVEPGGRYISFREAGGTYDAARYDQGDVTFTSPLVMPFGGGYSDPDNWKHVLSAQYGGKTGKALSQAVRAAGHDAIITHDKYGFSEIVDLTMIR
jgi:hypothetical protein